MKIRDLYGHISFIDFVCVIWTFELSFNQQFVLNTGCHILAIPIPKLNSSTTLVPTNEFATLNKKNKKKKKRVKKLKRMLKKGIFYVREITADFD